MQAEIITIGDEILIGQIVDTNSSWIGDFLHQYGIEILKIHSIKDNREDIIETLEYSLKRADFVLITGGLGPTKDDITKQTLADFFNTELIFNESVFHKIEERLLKRGIEVNELNRSQAYLPKGCVVLNNDLGTAQGMLFEKKGKYVLSMPGVPMEMKHILKDNALPYILQKTKSSTYLFYRVVSVYGLPESKLATIIEDIENAFPVHLKLAYLPHYNIVRLRISGKNTDESLLKKDVNYYSELIIERIGKKNCFEGDFKHEMLLGHLLNQKQEKISLAESCTGGYISHLLTSVPGSSQYFEGSVISYSYDVKTIELGVDKDIMTQKGAVSEEVVYQMAHGIQKKYRSHLSIAVSGIAGPGGGTPDKPVGTVCFGINYKNQSKTYKKLLIGKRLDIIKKSAIFAMSKAIEVLMEE